MPIMSAALRREQEQRAFDAYLGQCPSHRLLQRISDKWASFGEHGGPMHSATLSRHIPAASQKMLTQTLQGLERDGLVSRTVTPTVPVTVEYALTELGGSLFETLAVFKGWADRHYWEIEAARRAHAEVNSEVVELAQGA